MSALDDLIALLTVEPIGDTRFRGRGSANDGSDNVFGGHFLGQATAAALATVEGGRRIHSLHGYFLRAGRAGRPIDYDVAIVREGRSFCTRRVTAHQGDGPSFELLASFALPEVGRDLDPDPPADLDSLPAPTSIPRYPELMATHDPLPLPADWALTDRGLDVRVVDAPWAPGGPSPDGGIRYWARADGTLPDDPNLHAAALAYLSDDSVSDNVLVPFGVTWSTKGVLCVSLDHALWFHREVDLNEWLFVEQRPVVAAGARGLSTAKVWERSGRLVASFVQEALMRLPAAAD